MELYTFQKIVLVVGAISIIMLILAITSQEPEIRTNTLILDFNGEINGSIHAITYTNDSLNTGFYEYFISDMETIRKKFPFVTDIRIKSWYKHFNSNAVHFDILGSYGFEDVKKEIESRWYVEKVSYEKEIGIV